jgi:hypothetical protein
LLTTAEATPIRSAAHETPVTTKDARTASSTASLALIQPMVFFAMIASLMPGDRAGFKLQGAWNGDNPFVGVCQAAKAALLAPNGVRSWQFRHRSEKIDAAGYREASSRRGRGTCPSS